MSATIAARSNLDATLAAPVRKPPRGRKPPSLLGRLGRAAGARPGRSLALALFSAATVAILLNATLFQKARHPAPMGAAATASAPARPVERRVAEPAATTPAAVPVQRAAPLPPSRPGDLAARETQPRPPAPVAAPQTAPIQRVSVPTPAPAAPAARPAQRDPIADLINGADLRPPAEIRGAGAKPAAPRRPAEG